MRKLNRHGLPIFDSDKKKKTQDQELSKQQIRSICFAKTRGRCFYCGLKMTKAQMTVDHYRSKYLGGSDDISNLVACCFECNNLKAHLSVEDFRALFVVRYKRRKFYGERSFSSDVH